MEKFHLIDACTLITAHLSAKKKNVEEVWRVWFPSMIYDEMKEAEAIQKVVGLRGPIGVQQRICRRFWKHCFKSEPLPWIEDRVAERPTCSQGEVMEIALMKEAMTIASTGDFQAAILILVTNSPGAKKADSKEPAKGPASSKPVTKPAVNTEPKPKKKKYYFGAAPIGDSELESESDSEPAKNLAEKNPVVNPFGTPIVNPFGTPVENPFRNPFEKPSLPLENYSTERNKAAVKSSDKNTQQGNRRQRDDRSRSPSSSRSLTARRRSF